MAKNKKKREKSNNKVSRSVKKDVKSVSKVDHSGAKASEYVENLLELHKVQGVLLVRLQKEFVM
jgi:urocanate hydratase